MTLLTKLIEAGVKILDKRYAANKKESIFDDIVGYSDIKKEFVKALDATSAVEIISGTSVMPQIRIPKTD